MSLQNVNVLLAFTQRHLDIMSKYVPNEIIALSMNSQFRKT